MDNSLSVSGATPEQVLARPPVARPEDLDERPLPYRPVDRAIELRSVRVGPCDSEFLVRLLGTRWRDQEAEVLREYPDLPEVVEVTEYEVRPFDTGLQSRVSLGDGLIECDCADFQRRWDCAHVAAVARLERVRDYTPSRGGYR